MLRRVEASPYCVNLAGWHFKPFIRFKFVKRVFTGRQGGVCVDWFHVVQYNTYLTTEEKESWLASIMIEMKYLAVGLVLGMAAVEVKAQSLSYAYDLRNRMTSVVTSTKLHTFDQLFGLEEC